MVAGKIIKLLTPQIAIKSPKKLKLFPLGLTEECGKR